MPIIAVEVESIKLDGSKRQVWYRCQDDNGAWHTHGPVITADPAFDVEAHKTVVASHVGQALAEDEFEQLIGLT